MLYRFAAGAVSLTLLSILAGCNYGHEQFNKDGLIQTPDLNKVFVLEVDDYGRFWDRTAAENLYKTLEDESGVNNICLVTFIHGWHHNAEKSDTNLIDFQKTVQQIQSNANKNEAANARQALKLQRDLKVIGLYIGWRGRSLPSYLNYLTFWGRKTAAERIGEGDLRELLLELQNLYKRRNIESKIGTSDKFMGMVTIGHSFGGQVALRTVAEIVERDLVDDGKETEVVSGLGDLTVLVNPAVEAFQYERIHRIAKVGSFVYRQSPVLLTISAENDLARKLWFPLGRWVSRQFRASLKPAELQEWTQSLGMYEPQQTHRFVVRDKSDTVDEVDCKLVDFSKVPQVLKVGMTAIPDRTIAYYPFMVASTENTELVDGHNGIFSATFIDFLTEYVALSQGKRICIRREALAVGPALHLTK